MTGRELQDQGIRPLVLVIMGVSGCGKTTLAEGLHNLLGWPYQEGDMLHPRVNVEKMAAGIPLTDADRLPWLQACHKWLLGRVASGQGGILTCSALKRSYRDLLRADGAADIVFVYLEIPEDVLAERLQRRRGHYMPPSLLPSQLATLEPPTADEHPLVVHLEETPADLIAETIGLLRQRFPERTPERG
ncbi:thermoresistant gluconokinase [Komagataeibacter europaeus]|uniref:Gluconokinase n=2 Tax=Komagataeibacter europaeus TaxID=33995 RepID=A0A0D6Q327_KOMEU|nr:gluconokinase [Komagataeibacter europaeus]ARW17656.1 Gluconokinase [Komagataeibacter europaeus]KON64277.1 thermoresistant gluconokinase [Komagataeibacter europaeus]GAN97186.1 gluconokinase [Komagataeibacter europaeus NBRC 3261]GBQ42104.1 gluconokinase [Komagataeibacter europaeus LMG 18890]